jgi:hypothetical protein
MTLQAICLPIFSRKPLVSHILSQEAKMARDFNRVKRNVMYYRLIFISLGILFSLLAAQLFFHSPNWNFNLIFKSGSIAKEMMAGISAFFCLFTLWLGCHSRTSIELAKYYRRLAELEAKRIYKAKRKKAGKEERKELFDLLRLSFEDIEHAYKNTLNHIHYIKELRMPDTVKRRLKLMHLKNLYEYLGI